MRFEELPEEVRAALERGNAIACPTRCWPCQFDQHPHGPHTWMDPEDAEYAGHPWPLPEDVATAHPCGCRCTSSPRREARHPR